MSHLTVDRATVVEHHQPRESGSSTASATIGNYLVRLEGTVPGATAIGIGEGQPRGRSTGDDPVASWSYLEHAARQLPGLHVPVGDRSGTLAAVSQQLDDMRQHPDGTPSRSGKAYRGTRLGIESALLDLAARAGGTSLAGLLGSQRDQLEVVAPALAMGHLTDALARRYLRQREAGGAIRFDLGNEPSNGMRNLLALVEAHPRPEPETTWWLEARAGLAPTDARDLVALLVKAMRRGQLPRQLILEQPVDAARRDDLAGLQREADRASRRRQVDLRIMADESLADHADLDAVTNKDGCRALNLKPARVGGLLAVLALTRAALDRHPDTVIALSSMAGSTDVGYWAMQHLALAMPRLDYFTRPPARAAGVNITDRAPEFLPDTRALAPGSGSGVDVDIQPAALLPGSGRYLRWPRPADESADRGHIRSYPEERATQLLNKAAMRSHLVEREALAHGMATIRYSPTVFAARPADGPLLTFGASARAPVSGACSFIISDQHKGAAHALLSRAGVPVPDGRVFAPSDLAGAVSFAQSIGFPVVSKPVSGTGGAGVSTNLRSPEELAAGFRAIRATRFASDDVLVQRHIPGEVYRIIVHDDEVTAALLRIAPSITGDGRRSIAELAIEKNSYRGQNPRLRKGLISQERTAEYLAGSGLDLNHVPGSGQVVQLAKDAYLNLGGDSVDILDELHPSIADIAVRAVAAIPELRFCGVDILLEDHRKPADSQSVGICELNACPELITPQYPLYGEPRFIARRLLRMAAARHDVAVPTEPSPQLSCQLRVTGRVGDEYVRWVLRRAREFGLRGWVAEVDQGEVEILAVGDTVPVSALSSAAISGPRDSAPVSVSTRHVAAPQVDGFSALPADAARAM